MHVCMRVCVNDVYKICRNALSPTTQVHLCYCDQVFEVIIVNVAFARDVVVCFPFFFFVAFVAYIHAFKCMLLRNLCYSARFFLIFFFLVLSTVNLKTKKQVFCSREDF